MWILALDVGTSSIRAIGYDALGRPLPGADARVSWEPAATPDGGSELDPEDLVAATALAIDRCLASAFGPPAAVGASVFWHSLLALDGDGRPLTKLITWADTRSAGAAEALRARLDETAVHARTGAPLHSTFFPAKLTWLRQARPDVFARAATWCGFAEYLLLRLTGRLRASVSMASGTGLLDQRAGAWDTGMLDACGIGPGRLPPLDDAPLIGLAPAWRVRWPTLGNAPWLPATGDDAALDAALAAVAPDSHGLTALPFLAGERSPGWRGDARAAVAGISLATTAPQILRALVEAVACRLAAVYDRLAPVASPGHAVVASGGALGHSRVFTQVLADALGVPLEVREGTEASSRGAALLALGALGRPAPPPEPSGSLVRPDPRRHDLYAAARARQGRLYDSVVGPRVS